MDNRSKFLCELTNRILALPEGRIQRVAIDGVDGAGKTTLANELAPRLELEGRPVIRASVDGFHNPRIVRYRLGKTSPEGFMTLRYGAARSLNSSGTTIVVEKVRPHHSYQN